MSALKDLQELIAGDYDFAEAWEEFGKTHGTALANLIAKAEAMDKLYGNVWDRTDGCLVVFPEKVTLFDTTFEEFHAALVEVTREPK